MASETLDEKLWAELASDPPESQELRRRITLTPASAITMRPVHWTWHERIPAGAITVIPGREGIGKSLTLAWLAAQITNGVLPGRHHGTPKSVIYAATEDSWAQTIAPRLAAAGADLDRVFRVDVDNAGIIDALTLPRDCNALAEHIQDYDVALLAADPLLSLVDASIDTHNDRKVRLALEPLAKMADKTGCAVVGLAHFNKSANTDALSLITGSRAFSAVARAVIAIARDPEDDAGGCVMSQAKNNLGRLDVPSYRYVVESAEVPTAEGPAQVGRLVITGESDRSVADILLSSSDNATPTEQSRTTKWLTNYLTEAGGSAPAEEIRNAAAAAGIAERTLKRARRTAGIDAISEGFPRRTTWTLRAD